MGRPQTTRFPDGDEERSGYEFGQLATWRTRKGQLKRLHYDARGREDSHTWDAGAAADVTRIWDDANRLTGISNAFSVIDFGYDDAGQVRWEGNNVIGSFGRNETTYFRYPSGEVSQVTYPNQTAVSRIYTARGQLKSVGWGIGNTSYAYLPDGRVDYQARSNGVSTTYGYDGRGIISSLRHTKDGHDLAKRAYWRDDRDRITAWKRGTDNYFNQMEDGRGNRYGYDDEGQLDSASYRALTPEATPSDAKRTDSFQYDKLGNREGRWNHVASRGTWMSFARRDNGLNQYLMWENDHAAPDPTHWGSPIYYDENWGSLSSPPPTPTPVPGNGVTMADGYVTASFNALNQPIAIWSSAVGPVTFMWFGYDPLGRCVKRYKSPQIIQGTPPALHSPPTEFNPATYFYYDGWNLIQEGPARG